VVFALVSGLDFIVFVLATVIMLVGSLAIPPFTVVMLARKSRSWDRTSTALALMFGLAALLQCAYMISRLLQVSPF